MSTSQNPIEEALLEFIAQETGVEDVDMSLDLIESGLLDSLLIMSLVAFVDVRFGVRAEVGDISPTRFRSVKTLTEWIHAKRAFIAKAA